MMGGACVDLADKDLVERCLLDVRQSAKVYRLLVLRITCASEDNVLR